MKKILLASTAVIALYGAPAFAADMPVKAAPLPLPVVSWTGCYVGANLGAVESTKRWTDFTGTTAGGASQHFSAKPGGLAYGGQLGCDYQVDPKWVVGIRGMWDGTNARRNSQILNVSSSDFWQTAAKISSIGTVVGKLGYLVTPTFQLYGVAGVGFVRDKFSETDLTAVTTSDGSQSRSAFVGGIGLDWMFAPHWDAFVEADFMDFGTKTVQFNGSAGSFTDPIRQNVGLLLVGVNYRFDWGKSPVVAKY
jgi:outer membrane immunogenic protein